MLPLSCFLVAVSTSKSSSLVPSSTTTRVSSACVASINMRFVIKPCAPGGGRVRQGRVRQGTAGAAEGVGGRAAGGRPQRAGSVRRNEPRRPLPTRPPGRLRDTGGGRNWGGRSGRHRNLTCCGRLHATRARHPGVLLQRLAAIRRRGLGRTRLPSRPTCRSKPTHATASFTAYCATNMAQRGQSRKRSILRCRNVTIVNGLYAFTVSKR